MKTSARPSSRRLRATAKSRSTSTPLSAAVGSSMISRLASREIALAISMICWSAMESPSAGRRGSMLTPRRVKSASASACIAARSMRRIRPRGWRPMKMFSVTERSGKSVGSW